MSWLRFMGLDLTTNFVVNIFFALICFLVFVEHLTGIDGTSKLDRFFGAFFYSE
jgi:inward rectifier potassium channel